VLPCAGIAPPGVTKGCVCVSGRDTITFRDQLVQFVAEAWARGEEPIAIALGSSAIHGRRARKRRNKRRCRKVVQRRHALGAIDRREKRSDGCLVGFGGHVVILSRWYRQDYGRGHRPLLVRRPAPGRKELLNDLPAFRRQHAGNDTHAMIERRMLVRVLGGFNRAGLGLRHAEHQFRDPRVNHRAHAHETRLDGHIQRRAGQTIVAGVLRRCPHRDDLGVGRRIAGCNGLIVARTDDHVVHDDDGADRDFAGIAGPRGLLEGGAHELGSRLRHDGVLFLLRGWRLWRRRLLREGNREHRAHGKPAQIRLAKLILDRAVWRIGWNRSVLALEAEDARL
jgi:hypothetical protein